MSVVVVFSTFPGPDKAEAISRALVSEGHAACANLIPGVRSFYVWDGALQEDQEILVVLKTTRDRLTALTARLVELHPYKVPEVIALPVDGGHAPYLEWVGASNGVR